MQILHDSFIVLLDKRYNSDETASGIITLSEGYMEDWAEAHLKNRRQYGVVLGVPMNFTDTIVDVVVPGMPEPRLFVSGEHRQSKIDMGFRKMPEYYPSTYDAFPTVTIRDIAAKTDIKKFDKVYFDYMVTDNTRYLGPHKHGHLYQARVDEIYCSVRDNNIIPQGEWCLVEPDYETWEDITSPSGLITKAAPGAKFERVFDNEGQPVDWKMVIEGKYLQGTLRYVRTTRHDVKSGDKILYQLNADYLVPIEGKGYYVMKDEDLLCKV